MVVIAVLFFDLLPVVRPHDVRVRAAVALLVEVKGGQVSQVFQLHADPLHSGRQIVDALAELVKGRVVHGKLVHGRVQMHHALGKILSRQIEVVGHRLHGLDGVVQTG